MIFHISHYEITLPFAGLAMLLLYIAMVGVSIIAIVRIVQRAGFSGWWTLILLVPVVNVFGLWYFGFAPRPAFANAKHP
jgi:uncharacterized membrane protein YhaH (DUF805 family)